MVLDPIKRAKGFVSANPIGAIAGGVAGVMLIRRYTPMRGWLGITLGVVGGAVSGAFAQSKLQAFKGNNKSANAAKT